jgi:hypothetical protein
MLPHRPLPHLLLPGSSPHVRSTAAAVGQRPAPSRWTPAAPAAPGREPVRSVAEGKAGLA